MGHVWDLTGWAMGRGFTDFDGILYFPGFSRDGMVIFMVILRVIVYVIHEIEWCLFLN